MLIQIFGINKEKKPRMTDPSISSHSQDGVAVAFIDVEINIDRSPIVYPPMK